MSAMIKSGENVNPQVLLEKRMIRRIKGRLPQIKILGDGKLTKALITGTWLPTIFPKKNVTTYFRTVIFTATGP